MPRLPESLDHLETAIERLERSIDSRERGSLADRDRLNAELNDLKASHAALQTEARTVYARLDQIIGRLKAVADN